MIYVPPVVLATSVIQILIAVSGVICNLIVILTLLIGTDRLDTSSVTYVMNLATADALFLLTVPFKIVESIYLRWDAGSFMCNLIMFVTYINFMVSTLFLMVMSIDRFLAINKATTSAKYRTTRSARIVSAIVWLISCACVLPVAIFHSVYKGARCKPQFPEDSSDTTLQNETLFSFDNYEFDDDDFGSSSLENTSFDIIDNSRPTCKYVLVSQSFLIWTICDFFYSFVLPFVIIIGCYCAILRRIYTKRGTERSSRNIAAHQKFRRRKVTFMVASLVIAYLVCYSPYHVWRLAKMKGVHVANITTCAHIERFIATMSYLNSMINPIIYGFMSGMFSKKFRKARKSLRKRPNTL